MKQVFCTQAKNNTTYSSRKFNGGLVRHAFVTLDNIHSDVYDKFQPVTLRSHWDLLMFKTGSIREQIKISQNLFID